MRPQALPGFVPKLDNFQVQKPANDDLRHPAVPAIRSDFAQALEQRLGAWIGQPGQERFERLQIMVKPFMKTSGEQNIDLALLPPETLNDLARLQGASEGIESIFLKKLLGQMHSVRFDGQPESQMAEFARERMDQAIADQAAKGGSSIGIAKMIFLDTAQTLVRSAIAKPATGQMEQ